MNPSIPFLQNQRTLVIGESGQVGSCLKALLIGVPNVAYTDLHPKSPDAVLCDLASDASITEVVTNFKPTIVINCAAYTAVDLAEQERELCFRVNGAAPECLARICDAHGAILIHYSTDYVFNGAGDRPRLEDEPTDPLNVYGASKLAGEQGVLRSCSRAYVFRTQWVYTKVGKNFVNTMLRLGQEREELSVVDDQVGAPTSAEVIAEYTLKAVEKILAGRMTPGIYNLVCRGAVSWHGFAKAIFDIAPSLGYKLKVKSVKPIQSEQFPTPAERPKNSRLSTKKLETELGVAMPTWEHALRQVMEPIQK